MRKGDPKNRTISKMRRQKNTQQMKEQGQNKQDLTNEEEIGGLPEKEFRIMIVKMIQNLGNRIDKMQETFNKDVEELKRNQAMMKHCCPYGVPLQAGWRRRRRRREEQVRGGGRSR